jgi:hypothetical protein
MLAAVPTPPMIVLAVLAPGLLAGVPVPVLVLSVVLLPWVKPPG